MNMRIHSPCGCPSEQIRQCAAQKCGQGNGLRAAVEARDNARQALCPSVLVQQTEHNAAEICKPHRLLLKSGSQKFDVHELCTVAHLQV
jgi:hypothetical protein